MLESCWPASLAQFTCSKFHERLGSKIKAESTPGRQPAMPPWFSHVYTHEKTHTNYLKLGNKGKVTFRAHWDIVWRVTHAHACLSLRAYLCLACSWH